MYLLYLDEFGHPGPYVRTNPRYCQHPLFGFAGFAVPGERLRDFDRSFLRLKGTYYANEIRRAQTLKGVRPERFEPKRLQDRRDTRFAADVMGLVGSCRGSVFAYGCVKNTTVRDHSYEGLYNSHMQGALRQFEKYLRDAAGRRAGRGVIIMDRRTETQNARVLASAQSSLFSDPTFKREHVRLVEAPLLVPSEWYHGVQAAHVIGQAVGKVYWYIKLAKAEYGTFHKRLHPIIQRHTHTIGGWHSVYVRS
ncbi:MAG: DUF3800 domain-containing protein [Gemmatimonadota bacterium]